MSALTIEARSIAALATAIQALDIETRATIVATENGAPWATLSISHLTDSKRAVFPLYQNGVQGDTRKRGQAGVISTATDSHPLTVVIGRAARMHRS